MSLMPSPACTANTVYIIMGIFGEIVINHQLNSYHINPPRCDIGSYKYLIFARFKPL